MALSEPIIPLPDAVVSLLPKLPAYVNTIVASFVFFTFAHLVLAPFLLDRLFPETYGKSGRRAKNAWAIHVVSQIHALIVIPLCVGCLGIPVLDRDRVFGWDERIGVLHGVACGYFLWDTLDAIINFTDIGFVIHGALCTAVYSLGYKPFLAYYGVRCLLWESSTIFLNIHWFLDKTGKTGSKFQLYNGLLLMSTFFGVRLMFGGKTSYDFWMSLYAERERISTADKICYGLGNIVLQSLNWFWFSKMISALRKRFVPSKSRSASNGMISNGHGVMNGNAHHTKTH